MIKNWNGASSRWTILGTIKIGEKATNAEGKEYPKAVDHFICPPEVLAATVAFAQERDDAENLAAAQEGKPRTLYITFPFGQVEDVMPHAYKYYGSSTGLKCMGDGEWIQRRAGDDESDPPGVQHGRNMLTLKPEPCDRTACPFAQASKKKYRGKNLVVPAPCQATGYLHFIVWNVYRTGVYRLKVSSLAIRQALVQFALVERAFTRIDGLPYLLHLTQKTEQTPNGMKPLWVPWLEVDPVFVEQNFTTMRRTLTSPARAPRIGETPPREPLQLVDSVTGEIVDEDAEGGPSWSEEEWLAGEEEADPEPERSAAEATAELFGDPGGNGDEPEEIEAFTSPQAAIAWGYDQGAFKAVAHARNAYAKLKEEKAPTDAVAMATLWRSDVACRLTEMAAEAIR